MGKYTGLILSQFLLFLQNKGVYLCHAMPSEKPRMLNASEIFSLKEEFKQKIYD